MEISLAVLAVAANVSADNNLNILGTFDTIHTPVIPFAHPHFVLAIQLLAEYENGGTTQRLLIERVDSDGRAQLDTEQIVDVKPLGPGLFSVKSCIVQFVAYTFPREGRYRFNVKLEGGPEKSVVVQVIKRP